MSEITKEQEDIKVEEILSQPYAIILHNDDFNSFDFVIECLMKFCGHQYEQASQVSHIVHYKGKCDVKRGTKETLKKPFSKLKAAKLTVTLEEV